MQEIFKENLDLKIYRTDSPEAIPYRLKSSTNVFVNDELVPLAVATSATEMEKYLSGLM